MRLNLKDKQGKDKDNKIKKLNAQKIEQKEQIDKQLRKISEQ